MTPKLFEKAKVMKAEAKARVDRTVERVTKAFETKEPMPIAFAKLDDSRVAVVAMPDGTIQLRLYEAPVGLGVGRILEADDIAMEAYYAEPKPIAD